MEHLDITKLKLANTKFSSGDIVSLSKLKSSFPSLTEIRLETCEEGPSNKGFIYLIQNGKEKRILGHRCVYCPDEKIVIGLPAQSCLELYDEESLEKYNFRSLFPVPVEIRYNHFCSRDWKRID